MKNMVSERSVAADGSSASVHPNSPAVQMSASRRQLLQLAGVGAMLYWLPGCGNNDEDSADADKLSDAIQWGRAAIVQALQGTDATAISVALLSGDNIVWQEAFGMADTQARAAATPETRFNIGSVSKVIAALAAMILCDRGQLALDAPISRYLPGFSMLSAGYDKITLRHLLSHSSGLPGTNWRNIFSFAPVADYAQDTQAGLARFHLKHEPGELAVYCNDGFTMVENLVAAVTGLSFPDFVQREILQPLGMTHSAYPTQPFAAGSFVHPVHQGQSMGQEFVGAYATGGLASTPGDMMKLAALFMNQGMHQGKRIVSQAAVQEMGSDQTTGLRINPCPEWRWALGWDSARQPGLDKVGIRAWQKNGGTAFFSTEFFVLPEQRLCLLLSGTGGYGPLRIAEGVLLRALTAMGQIKAVPVPLEIVPPSASTSASNAAIWAGIYGNYEAPYKVLAVDAATLDILQWKSGVWAPLVQGLSRRADGWWWSDASPSVNYRWETIEGRLYLLSRVVGGSGHYRLTLTIGQRLAATGAPLSAAWQAQMGTRWQPTNESSDSVALRLGDGIVSLSELPDLPGYIMWNGTQLLKPEGDSRARMTVQVPVNHGRDLVELEMRTINGQEELRVGASIYRKFSA